MTIGEFKRKREKLNVSRLDVAARSGLPEDYIEKIEEKTIVALEGDVKRLERALAMVIKERSEPDEIVDGDEPEIDMDDIQRRLDNLD